MNRLHNLIAALVLTSTPVFSQTTIFSDNFSTSTLNGATATPTASSTSYQVASSKNSSGAASSITSGDLKFSFPATTSGFAQIQARFANSAVSLSSVGDYINLQFTFTATANILGAGSGSGSYLTFGLYNSGGVAPLANGVLATSGLTTTASNPNSTGGVSLWSGYVSRIATNGGSASQIYTRPQMSLADTSSQNQDLIGNNWGGGAYDTPQGNAVSTAPSSAAFSALSAQQYTATFKLTLSGASQYTLDSALYSGAGTGGTQLFAQSGTASGANFLTSSFDGLAIGYRFSGTSAASQIDVNSLEVTASIVPEPATATISGLGILGLLMAYRRNRR